MTDDKQHRGFTLIEIIVAVGIFAVLSAMVFPGLIKFLEVRDRIEQKQQQLIKLHKTFLFMENDLQFIVNRSSKDEYGDVGNSTLNTDQDVIFGLVTTYPDIKLEGLNVPRKVLWKLEDGVLSRVQSPVMDVAEGTRRMTQHLLKNVRQVDIKFHSHQDKKEKEDGKWDQTDQLPEMIEITIELQAGLKYTRFFDISGEPMV